MHIELTTAIVVMAVAAVTSVAAGLFMETVSIFVDDERRKALINRCQRLGIFGALSELMRTDKQEDELFLSRRAKIDHHRHTPHKHAKASGR